MHISATQVWLALLGTLLCGATLFRRKGRGFDILRPHFVIPFMIWYGTFAQVLQQRVFLAEFSGSIDFATYVEQTGSAALLFILTCTVCFYVGYLLPLGRKLAQPFVGLPHEIALADRFLRPIGILSGLLIFALLMLSSGPAAFDSHWQATDAVLFTRISGPLSYVIIMIGAAAIGMSFPLRIRDQPFAALFSWVALFLMSLPSMANFSRGTGLAVAIAAVAYCIRRRQLRPVVLGLAIIWCAACAFAGLTGRGIYGHRGGVFPFLYHLVTTAPFHPIELIHNAFGAGDAFTATSTVMVAMQATDIGALSMLDWFIFQIPVPRVIGLHPEWTVSVPIFLGGVGSWNYTTSIFGDLFLHFEWFGALAFVFLGAMYRIVDTLAFDSRSENPYSINLYILLCGTSYLAMFMGLFNSFRAWNVAFFYPFYLIVAMLVMLSVFRPRPMPVAYTQQHQ